jgi:hypothetical protein
MRKRRRISRTNVAGLHDLQPVIAGAGIHRCNGKSETATGGPHSGKSAHIPAEPFKKKLT